MTLVRSLMRYSRWYLNGQLWERKMTPRFLSIAFVISISTYDKLMGVPFRVNRKHLERWKWRSFQARFTLHWRDELNKYLQYIQCAKTSQTNFVMAI